MENHLAIQQTETKSRVNISHVFGPATGLITKILLVTTSKNRSANHLSLLAFFTDRCFTATFSGGRSPSPGFPSLASHLTIEPGGSLTDLLLIDFICLLHFGTDCTGNAVPLLRSCRLWFPRGYSAVA